MKDCFVEPLLRMTDVTMHSVVLLFFCRLAAVPLAVMLALLLVNHK